jgi:hypothetical protein
MEEGIKRWAAKRKVALVLKIIQGKTTLAAASRLMPLLLRKFAKRLPRARKPTVCHASALNSPQHENQE